MINPGVITLASLNATERVCFPYRFEIEDNIGEAIHIHYKDIRLDLTTKEFETLALSMAEIIDRIVDVEGFACKDFDPVVLVGISGGLPKLKKIEYRDLFLEDIQVDTYDEDGNPIYAGLEYSRVVKALNGICRENDDHLVQLNHYKNGSVERMTNQERVLFNLERIRKYGYPVGNEYIGVDAQNRIWDGQHRAACLYYLYGNIKVRVRQLFYDDTDEYLRNIKSRQDDYEYELYIQEKQDEMEMKKDETEVVG